MVEMQVSCFLLCVIGFRVHPKLIQLNTSKSGCCRRQCPEGAYAIPPEPEGPPRPPPLLSLTSQDCKLLAELGAPNGRRRSFVHPATAVGAADSCCSRRRSIASNRCHTRIASCGAVATRAALVLSKRRLGENQRTVLLLHRLPV